MEETPPESRACPEVLIPFIPNCFIAGIVGDRVAKVKKEVK
jgi:hypothetical protein